MRKVALCRIDETTANKFLNEYLAANRFETELDVRLYRMHRFHGYSTLELAAKEHMNRSTIYRRIKKVDKYIETRLSEGNDRHL